MTCFAGADDEARTRYLHLGKVALYQMSYIRIFRNKWYYTHFISACQYIFFRNNNLFFFAQTKPFDGKCSYFVRMRRLSAD